MAKFTELSWRGVWIGTTCLFGVVFFVNYRLYVMPDALSMTIGALLGSYLFGWLVWRITKLKMGSERAPEPRYFVFVLACLSAAVTILPHVAAFLANAVSANQECIKGLPKTDMCAKARQLSDEIATKLPIKMSQNMSWESVTASGATIQAHITLSYNKKHLEETYMKAGLPLPQAKQAIQKAAANICQENTPTRAFINLGGSVKYVYSFVDGEQFTTVVVSSCN